MPVTKESPGPYAPSKTVLDVVGRYRHRGLPAPINGEVLGRAGVVADSLIPRTLSALQSLDLIDEAGNPTETLEGLRLAPESEFQARLADWLRTAYAEVFTYYDPVVDDESRVRDAFRSYHPIGQQTRMVSLFQGLAAAAGLLRETPKSSKPQRPKLTGSTPLRANPPLKARVVHALRASPQRVGSKSGTIQSTNGVPSLPPALQGLLSSLPLPEKGWTQQTRDQFVTAFEHVLDFCIPIVQHEDQEQGDGDLE